MSADFEIVLFMHQDKKDKSKGGGNEAGGGDSSVPKTSSKTGKKPKSEKKNDKKGKSLRESKSHSTEDDSTYENDEAKEQSQNINPPLLPVRAVHSRNDSRNDSPGKRNRTKLCYDLRHKTALTCFTTIDSYDLFDLLLN